MMRVQLRLLSRQGHRCPSPLRYRSPSTRRSTQIEGSVRRSRRLDLRTLHRFRSGSPVPPLVLTCVQHGMHRHQERWRSGEQHHEQPCGTQPVGLNPPYRSTRLVRRSTRSAEQSRNGSGGQQKAVEPLPDEVPRLLHRNKCEHLIPAPRRNQDGYEPVTVRLQVLQGIIAFGVTRGRESGSAQQQGPGKMHVWPLTRSRFVSLLALSAINPKSYRH